MGDSPYGITNNVPNNGGNPNLLSAQQITDLQGWGASAAGNWLRYMLKWQSIEQSPGVYTWNVFDDAVAKCNAGGINMCWPVFSPPAFRQSVDPATGNFTGPTQTSAAITHGVQITSIAVVALPAGTTLVNGSVLTVDVLGANPETVTVNHNGGYGAGATSIAITPWTPSFDHSSGVWVISTLAVLENATDTATFATAVATRYNGQNGHGTIAAIQIGNEEFDSSMPRDSQSQWLVPVVNAAYPAIKMAYPACRVGVNAVRKTQTNALAHLQNWLTNLYTYQGGIGSHADWLDFHYYRGGSSAGPDPTTQDANTPSIVTELATMKSIPAAYGYNPQIWCGETGWDLYDDGTCLNPPTLVSPAAQAQYIQAMFDAMRTGGGTKCFVYTMNPNATVSALAGCSVATTRSTEIKSIVQTISGTYTYEPAYAMIQSYQQQYPTWGSSGSGQPPSIPPVMGVLRGRDGKGVLRGR